MLPQKVLKITFLKLAEIDFPGIKFTRKSKMRNMVRFDWIHEISSHACAREGGGVASTHNKWGCAILTRKVGPKNLGTRNARLSF